LSVYAVVPAAGAGKRFGAVLPKQYLDLAGLTIQQRTINTLTSLPEITRVVLVVAPDDERAQQLTYQHPNKLQFVNGGAERMDSVLAGLLALQAGGAQASDWVLVHDVARPLLRASDVHKLLQVITDHDIGGLLANPVRDTMKRANLAGAVEKTVAREGLWHALTPQAFRLGLLIKALQQAQQDAVLVTDEASAIERLGLQPLLVEGARDNLKITYFDDLALAHALLSIREDNK
jgi:2-C-methyl-D-erythritol 4-phosphate cytidylyltransferase